ncbi:MAG: HAMP domain-containing histidine kinase [Sedimentisphaerales bacterium]|nr:HAMP domain-containing histidine kinase [Sedimentisphaerales bacterium]
MVRIADLIQISGLDKATASSLVLSPDTPVKEALFRMQEMGCDSIRVENDRVIVLSKEDLLTGLLRELDSAQAMLHSLQNQVEGGLADQLDLVQESVRALAQTEKSKLEIAVNNLSEGLIILDRSGRIESANPAARHLLTKGQNNPLEAIYEVLDQLEIRDQIKKAQEKAAGKGGESRIKAGNDRMLNVRWTPMHDEWGHFLGNVVMVRDVTEQYTVETAKSDFITSVSHELRTPLTSIQNMVSNIQAGVAGCISNKMRDYLGTMKSDCHRLTDLVNDLLDMAKLEAGSMPINRCVTNLTELMEQIVEDYSPVAKQKRIQINKKIPTWMQPVYADSRRIVQVVNNLLDNAIKFTDPDGIIQIHLYDNDNSIFVEVEDTGIGIESHLREQIFSKFYQINRRSGPGSQGSGLGLAICQGIITAHGGSIWVDGDREKGSRFCFSLPKCDSDVILKKHLEVLNSQTGSRGDEIALMVLNCNSHNSADMVIGLFGGLMKRILAERNSILVDEGDLAVQMNDSEAIFVLCGRLSHRVSKLNKMIRKIVGNHFKKKWKEASILPMVGLGVYPADTGDLLELVRIARIRMKPLL